ncbi:MULTISPECIES: Arm DNA-binding domain-containing protein, partial [unclassified Caballeronia]|uniref:Arm DNA-binding domain-containing protein n=1 Tax=unclassified Caballeronia TaxID=2646786 RepID=UPI00285E5A78
MRLTNITIRNARSAGKARKLFDGRGLYLLLTPSGSKCWRMKYRFAGREKLMSLGMYPDVSLAEARERHAQARKVLSGGVDPVQERRKTEVKPYVTFREAAEAWLVHWKPSRSPSRVNQVENYLASDIYPIMGGRPVT